MTKSRAEQLRQCTADDLTPRELDVIRAVILGYKNQQIGTLLNIQEETVKTHLRSCYAKTRTHSRLELMIWAQSSDLLLTDKGALT